MRLNYLGIFCVPTQTDDAGLNIYYAALQAF